MEPIFFAGCKAECMISTDCMMVFLALLRLYETNNGRLVDNSHSSIKYNKVEKIY
jgi:hypothetical protein